MGERDSTAAEVIDMNEEQTFPGFFQERGESVIHFQSYPASFSYLYRDQDAIFSIPMPFGFLTICKRALKRFCTLST